MKAIRRFHLKNPLGNRGENDAATFLRSLGYKILDRNYRNAVGKALGEIDIVAKDGDEIVFVEVKARTASERSSVLPEESITFGKLRKLERISSAYLREKSVLSAQYRFDAVLVMYGDSPHGSEIRHFKSIFL
ncbi:MAG: YraN family protein [Candidatus Moranbacteria bacterium]|jgi:putative endonuclease|nr:YraN family protein [Candidatus Moranbacteria bacterium]